MLTLSNLSVHFGGRHLFDNVSVMVGEKDKIGLIGRNGTGKSTLLKIISGIDEASSGDVVIPNEYTIGYLPQEIQSESELTVMEETQSALKELQFLENEINKLTEQLGERQDYESNEYMKIIERLNHHTDRLKILGGDSIQGDIEQVLKGLGFSRSDFVRPMNEFSGGWQMRVELAKILLSKPNCVLLDEPTNHLDIESVQWLENFLRNYFGAIILVSHDRRFLDTVTNRTFELTGGKIIDMNFNYTDFMQKRQEQRELELAQYKNQQKEIEQTERFIERFRSKASLATRVQSRIKALEKVERIELEEVDSSSIRLKFPEPPRSSRLVCEGKKLSKSYGDLLVLKSIDFAIERGEKLAFVGKNGEGKSTLSRIIAGSEPYEGELIIGSNVQIGYYAQHQSTLFNPDLNVFDVIDTEATGDARPYVRSILGAFMFSGDDVYKKVKVLSGGEKSRLSLARLMLKSYNLLILDEPTNHLDMAAKDVLKQALIDYQGSLIIVSHDREFLEGLTNKTIEFKNNKIHEFLGDINYYLEKMQMENLRELELSSKKGNSDSDNQASQNQLIREERKNIQRQIGKLKKEIEQIEAKLALLENENAEFEISFSDAEFFKDIELSAQAQSKYKENKTQIEVLFEKWDTLSSSLMELESLI
ncbi:MAG: ABC-F family ATP-binding cassette domain-containing protein [Candidatus Kapabacteria bacterium]|nr:ABC-F family ATP-binding cassette domain-containing protein [Ignavibacteriota bacterium]MCW5883886.1 ABC-F family ATP-binding cassette domain-containing protein [Candidatus Kapabacteria bacterium]